MGKMLSGGHIPLFKRLTSYYRDRIIRQDMPPGSGMDSINKMISRHGVSRETAKLVLRNLVNEGLVTSVQGKGSFVTFRSDLIPEWGVVIPFLSSNMESLVGSLSRQAEMRKRSVKFQLTYNQPDEEMRIVGEMIRSGFEAIVVVPNYNESLTAGFYRRLIEGRTKVILADNTMAGSFFNYVIQSYDLGVKRAFDYLVSKKEGNLLFLRDQIWKGTNLLNDLMEQTFTGLAGERKPLRKVFIMKNVGDLKRSYITENSITGILACNDSDSIKVTGRLMEWGFLLREEIALVCYGNTELTGYFRPGITAINCRYDEMARITAEMIESSGSSASSKQHVIQPLLIERET